MARGGDLIRDITPLALGAGVLFLVARSGVLKNLAGGIGQVASGAGTAVQATGGAVRDVLSPLGVLREATEENIEDIEQIGKIRRRNRARESLQAEARDIEIIEPEVRERVSRRQQTLTGLHRTFLPTPEEGAQRRERARVAITSVAQKVKTSAKGATEKIKNIGGSIRKAFYKVKSKRGRK